MQISVHSWENTPTRGGPPGRRGIWYALLYIWLNTSQQYEMHKISNIYRHIWKSVSQIFPCPPPTHTHNIYGLMRLFPLQIHIKYVCISGWTCPIYMEAVRGIGLDDAGAVLLIPPCYRYIKPSAQRFVHHWYSDCHHFIARICCTNDSGFCANERLSSWTQSTLIILHIPIVAWGYGCLYW